MQQSDLTKLADLISRTRRAAGMTRAELARQTGVAGSTITRIEEAQFCPRAETLATIGKVLDIPVSDLFAAADWLQDNELPSFAPYLRTKYRDLPADARQEIEDTFAGIAKKYGYDASGPAPGDDET
ncbi:helix-turn-helix domain-containing protein [Epidermidibacterium keratini]|uniref:Helix-turn-helix domain-containing protein n=1 Tax=Epidermidibacterium keratini TaxID=1891644 RepID=A0A7L4YKB1_9ACTN|nr:helix-turn-helix transcriptional regulator [Epidermidibacterium keratini]QHB99559.1 helix-turn-helix domain-containing protein [Epidermidibacterium keratini]